MVFGSLIATGQDSVRANVTLFDTRTGKSLGEVERRGLVASMDRLVDSVAYALLTQLSRTRWVGAFETDGARRPLVARPQGLPARRAVHAGCGVRLGTRRLSAIALDSAFPRRCRQRQPWPSAGPRIRSTRWSSSTSCGPASSITDYPRATAF